VLLNVSTEQGARLGFQRLRSLAADVRGVLVTPMLPPPIAEVLVGATRDPQFGPVLTIAAGGIAVELLRTATVRVLPVDSDDIEAMMNECAVGRLLEGLRGGPAGDGAALRQLALELADCFLSNPELGELEVNPVFVYEKGAIALDARAFTGAP
jgi:acetyl-CoA synthetase (ADP-forming)